MPTLRLTGRDLSIADVLAVARRQMPVALDRAAERRMSESAKVVADLAAGDAPVYGVNTGPVSAQASRRCCSRCSTAACIP